MACRMPIDPRTHKESLLARRVLEGEVSEDDVYNSLVPYVARSSSVQASAWVPYYVYTPRASYWSSDYSVGVPYKKSCSQKHDAVTWTALDRKKRLSTASLKINAMSAEM